MPDNMDLWNRVCDTDQKYTKKFVRSGGFSGLAINQTYQVRRATEVWGPVGDKWGYEIIKEEYVRGAQLSPDCSEIIHVATIRVWYPGSGDNRSFVEHKGATQFVGKNKYGFFTDEEAAKKSVTDGLSKCLSMLGFSADVYLGIFDDKYTNPPAATIPDQTPGRVIKLPEEDDASYIRAQNAVKAAANTGELDRLKERYINPKNAYTKPQIEALEKLRLARVAELG